MLWMYNEIQIKWANVSVEQHEISKDNNKLMYLEKPMSFFINFFKQKINLTLNVTGKKT